jgi:4-amino-4-deoxy-L-arabinose transferase-like glycosyltransferase
MIPRLALPPTRAALVVLALAFALPGLTGHDPWKTFDAVAIDIAGQMLRAGDWLVPRVAGEPWLEDPPFYHWTALAFAGAFARLLPLHSAVRLASGLFVLAALWLAYLAARHAAPPQERRAAGATAMLVLAGSIGLMVHAHEAVPELATLAAACAAFFFAAHATRKPLKAGLGFGAALGIAFLSTGWVTPAALGLGVALAVFACADWRNRTGAVFLAAALAAAVPIAASWPLALLAREPALAAQWWQLATEPRGTLAGNLRYFVVTSSWFAWPGWPLALWTLWARRTKLTEPRSFVPLAALVLAFAATALAGPAQDINAIAFLPPLALLAAQSVGSLRRGAANALDWFGVMCFLFFAGLVWLGYVAMMTGVPPRVANNFVKTAPGFAAQFDPAALALALALAAGWLYGVLFAPPSPTRGVLRWAAGVALLWGSFAALWMPWADYQKSYRGVALQLKSRLPQGAGCVARVGLGLPQRAALSYHAGIRTVASRSKCDYVIIQGSPRDERGAPGPGWVKLADVGRPGDRAERYRLYQRTP